MTPHGTRAIRILVSGRVQGVGFRQATAQRAGELGLAGWVRNLRDGRVEAEACGADQALEALLAWMRAGGPPLGRVTDLLLSPVDLTAPAAQGFRVAPSA